MYPQATVCPLDCLVTDQAMHMSQMHLQHMACLQPCDKRASGTCAAA
jgi:hypothetical protein